MDEIDFFPTCYIYVVPTTTYFFFKISYNSISLLMVWIEFHSYRYFDCPTIILKYIQNTDTLTQNNMWIIFEWYVLQITIQKLLTVMTVTNLN